MSITTEIQRLRTNVNKIRQDTSDILDAIANKGVTVPAGSSLDDCAGLVSQITGTATPTLYREQIKDNYYTYVQIGDRYFTIDNLAEDFTGVDTSYAGDAPYRIAISNHSDYGFYYNNLAVEIIDNWLSSNNSPWRVATKSDYESLLSLDAGDLKLPVTWDNIYGNTNKSCFSAFSAGYCNAGREQQLGINAYYITSTRENDKNYYMNLGTGIGITNTYDTTRNAWSVRLVKDV